MPSTSFQKSTSKTSAITNRGWKAALPDSVFDVASLEECDPTTGYFELVLSMRHSRPA